MPANRTEGMDHGHYPFSSLPTRPVLTWPGEGKLAVAPVVSLQFFDELATTEGTLRGTLAGGLGARPYPNYALLSHREYGHRVGIFRVLQAFAAVGMPMTVAIDARTAEGYPRLVERLQDAGAAFVAHGITAQGIITNAMGERQERAYIEEALARTSSALGAPVRGWLSPEQSESEHTPALLAAAGVMYVCDWVNDEQPYPMTVPQGSLLSVPLMLEYDDVWAMWTRGVRPDEWADMLVTGARVLREDAERTGRLLAFQTHPWLVGQPFRIGYLEDALEQIRALPGCWFATLDEVADACMTREEEA